MFKIVKSRGWQKEIIVSTILVLIFAFLGPFGTYNDLSFVERIMFWAMAIFGCGVFFRYSFFKTIKCPHLSQFHILTRLFIGAFLASFPATGLIYYIYKFFLNSTIPLEMLPSRWFIVFIIGIGITSIHFWDLLLQNSKTTYHKDAAKALNSIKTDAGIQKFLSRLPDGFSTNLVSLSMQDHYIKVVSDDAHAMLLMNFGDAIKELKNYPGIQIHRSHWVANHAIKEIKKHGRSHFVELKSGAKLPVSSGYIAIVSSKVKKKTI